MLLSLLLFLALTTVIDRHPCQASLCIEITSPCLRTRPRFRNIYQQRCRERCAAKLGWPIGHCRKTEGICSSIKAFCECIGNQNGHISVKRIPLNENEYIIYSMLNFDVEEIDFFMLQGNEICNLLLACTVIPRNIKALF
uniref:Uncharacterized protein n=1 Tax=Romanomermis culicivorax TaxID=13658 RepID=A0A915J141_ROMCU